MGIGVPQDGYLGQVADADGYGETEGQDGSHYLEEHGDVVEDVSKKPGEGIRGQRSEIFMLEDSPLLGSSPFSPPLLGITVHLAPVEEKTLVNNLDLRGKHILWVVRPSSGLGRSKGLRRRTHTPARLLSPHPVTAA